MLKSFLSLIAVLLSCFLFSQKKPITDNLPGFSGVTTDLKTGIISNVIDLGPFGDKDIAIEFFNVSNSNSEGVYYIGTNGREGFAHSLISGNNIYVTGQTNLNTGSFDDVIIGKVDIEDISNSWTKVYQGGLSDKGKRIYQDGSNTVLLANSNSSTTNLSLIILVHDVDGNLLQSKEIDFGESYFPTGFTSSDTHYYVSGYSISGSQLNGKILKVSKSDFTIDWSLTFDNANNCEINQIEYSDSKIYFSGWSGNGTNNALIYGEINLTGSLSWYRVVSHDGLANVTDMLVEGDNMYLSGFIRSTDGSEENEMISEVSLLDQSITVFINSSLDKSYSTGQLIKKQDSLFVSSFKIQSSTVFQGKLLNWEKGSGGCFSGLTSTGFEDHSSILNVTSFPVSVDDISLTLVQTGAVQFSTESFFEYFSCDRAEPLLNIVENKTCSTKVKLDNIQNSLTDDCNREFKKLSVYNLLGQVVYSSNNNSFDGMNLNYNQKYFVKSYWLDNGNLYSDVTKFIKQ